MSIAATFLKEVESFLERTDFTASSFGKAAVSDPNFVGDLRTGRSPSLALVDRVHDFIKTHDAKAASEKESAA